jgi:chromosome segregation ATPase
MHDFSLFLLEHLLPVGIAAIAFFLIGLLIARFLWGRYSQRLSFAVEENLNLASQWSALGSSQRDLFKKLRSRWQEDRDAWETRLADIEEQILAKETRISQLTRQLKSSGKEIPEEQEVDQTLQEEIRRLKAEIESRDEEIAELKELQENPVQVSPITPLLSGTAENGEGMTRLQELEQDLIDTHDELHQVREDYLKQVKVVESLEDKLIEAAPSAELLNAKERIEALEKELEAAGTPTGASSEQLFALLRQRSAELFAFRSDVNSLKAENRKLLESMVERSELEAVSADLDDRVKRLAEREEEIEDLKSHLNERAIEIESLHRELEERGAEMEALQSRLADAEILERRRISLQSELNDAHHEMYDVRKALRERLEEIEILELGMEELEASEAEAHALAGELKDTRHELSDVRIALNAKTSEYEQLAAEMEELEAIIEDRGAEVNDLSSEVRQQRDLIRQLKDSLAEKEGELEALGEESAKFSVTFNAKERFLNEQALRIADLENSLAERYRELNDVRSRMDEGEKSARYHEAQAEQLSAELERRREQFEQSDHRIATAEEEIEEAHAKIAQLTGQLTESEQTILDLREELSVLSRDKDEVIRQLERAGKRVEELEAAARERETRIVELEQEWRDSSREGEELLRKVEMLTSEIEEANENREASKVAISELEEALRGSDSRTLELSRLIEEKDGELDSLRSEVESMEALAAEKERRIVEATAELDALRSEMEEKLEIASQQVPEVEKVKYGETISQRDEKIEHLKAEIEDRETSLRQYVEQQKKSVAEIDQLRGKVAKRGDSIRELQNEISNIMMQRSARDNEISLLKDKLRSFEKQLEEASQSGNGESKSIKSLEAAIHQSLASEQSGGATGTSFDELDESENHHAPASVEAGNPEPRPAANVREPAAENGEEEAMDDDSVFFDEASAALTERSLGRIDEFARNLRRGGSRASVAIIGFAGSEGSADYKETLGAKRADAVRERLIERGVPRSRISVKSAGQDRRFSNWRARRVEMILIPNAVAESVN